MVRGPRTRKGAATINKASQGETAMKRNTKGIAFASLLILLLAGCSSATKNQPPPPAEEPVAMPEPQTYDFPVLSSQLPPDSFVLQGVHFDTDSAELKPESIAILDEAAEAIRSHPDTRWVVAGHTDSRDTDEHNMKLSQARAQAVYDYLVSRGVSPSQLEVQYFGEDMLYAEERSPEAMALNRRVEIVRVKD
ncbi:MAG: OmpA family protein [Gammaproteobacteria bacterium]|nr:MAG: OmpA family protein [Gammaproteobacteria bacterium]